MYLPYDTSFVFAEVNGDIIYWEVKTKSDYSMEKMRVYKNYVGSDISTKAVGAKSREDVTGEYKHPEGLSVCLTVCVVSVNASVMSVCKTRVDSFHLI